MNSALKLYADRFQPTRQHGAALVELALVLPILIILAFGFTELGRALYQKNQLTKEVNIGARYITRDPDAVTTDCGPGDTWTATESLARDEVAAALPGLDPADINIALQQRDLVVDGENRIFCIVEVSATMDFDALFGDSIVPMLDLGPITLSARTEERYIDG